MCGLGRLHHLLLQHLEQAGPEDRRALGVAGQIHDPVERDARLHRRVGVLEARLEVRVTRAEREQRAEVSAGRAAAHRHEGRVAVVLADVRLHPRHRALGVDDVIRPGRLRAQPVVDGDADPAPGDQLEHHRLALFALLADHPGAAVDVDHDGRLPRRRQAGLVDVEPVALVAVAPVVDVARDAHGARAEGDGPGDPPPAAPRRRRGLDGYGEGGGAHLGQRGRGHHGGPAPGEAQARPGPPSRPRPRPARASRPSSTAPRPR